MSLPSLCWPIASFLSTRRSVARSDTNVLVVLLAGEGSTTSVITNADWFIMTLLATVKNPANIL